MGEVVNKGKFLEEDLNKVKSFREKIKTFGEYLLFSE